MHEMLSTRILTLIVGFGALSLFLGIPEKAERFADVISLPTEGEAPTIQVNDLDKIQITADSPLWRVNPTTATWLLEAQSEEMRAALAEQDGRDFDARRHLRNAEQDRQLARKSFLSKH